MAYRKLIVLGILLLFTFAVSFADGRKTKVACIGNSVTYGYGHANRDATSYPTQLGKMLGDKYDVRNFGKSGATLLRKGHRPYDQQAEYKAALEFAPDLAIIHLGLNDTDPRNWPDYRDEFIPDYLALIDTLRTINPKARIFVCRMTPIFRAHPRFKSGTRDWHAQIQTAIEEVARIADAETIDLHTPLYNRPDLFADALHPNEEGAGIIAKSVYSAITGDYGGLSLPPIYGDNMIIQRDKPFTLKGTADNGKKVTARLGRERKTTTAIDGEWTIEFSPLSSGEGLKLEVESDGKEISFENIAVGEVWLCSGQSNMAFMLKEGTSAQKHIASTKGRGIRIYDMKPRVITNPVAWDSIDLAKLNRHDYYLPAAWQELTPGNAPDFSAVAYHFGAMLADSLQVPIGLICNAVGGAPAESFIDRQTLEHHPYLVDILYNWRSNDFVQPWVRQRSSQNIANSKNHLQRHPYEPCYLFETGIAPIARYPIRGAIWYQGESNAHNIEAYEALFGAMLNSWRKAWNDEGLPFYFVQLSSLNRPSWTHFRDAQRRLALATENCAMAVSSDHGNLYDVHPKEKQPIGQRLARQALYGTYGYKDITPEGPSVIEAKRQGATVCLKFKNGEGLTTSDGKQPRTFEIAADNGLYHPATVFVIGNYIYLKSKDVKHPARIRYGWQPYTTANLINSDSLPASTFQIHIK